MKLPIPRHIKESLDGSYPKTNASFGVRSSSKQSQASNVNSITADELTEALSLGQARDEKFEDLIVTGELDLSHTIIPKSLHFINCEFEGCFLASFAKFSGLHFSYCRLKKGIQAQSVTITGDLTFAQTDAAGPILLTDAAIFGDVVGTGLSLRKTELNLDSSSIEGSVRFNDCDFASSILAFGRDMSIKHRLEFLGISKSPAKLFLTGTSTGTYKEDGSVWPKKGCLHLDRFTYERLSVADNSLKRHVKWLTWQYRKHLRNDFRSQPWRHLTSYLRRRGSVETARRLAIIHKDKMLFAGAYGLGMSIVYFIFNVTCRYGLQPWLPVFWLLVLNTFGAVLLNSANEEGLISPSSAPYVIAIERGELTTLPDNYPVFSPLLYSIDITLPFIDLAQEKYYLARNAKDNEATSLSEFVPFYLPIHTILGWILVSLTILSFSGVFEKRFVEDI